MRAHITCEDIVTQPAEACQGQHQPIWRFFAALPRKPYHTDTLGDGLRIRDVQRALSARYIQPNGPTHRYWLVYDVDRSGAALDWNDRGARATISRPRTPTTARHLIYGLDVACRTAPDAKTRPASATAVDCALRALLDADQLCGLICKNPLHPHWRVTEWSHGCTIGDLDSWLDLSGLADRRKRLPEYGLGRNCNLFERLPLWAYKGLPQGWPDYDRWHEAVLTRARAYNDTDPALPDNEVRRTAKSVAKWTHQRLFPGWICRCTGPERPQEGREASR
uniref:Replication protein n=1 Tax=Halomonas elongata TaxID=2746 RepID=Q9X743_HALEL|nr:replication protein [Halomonas elongata]